MFKHSVIGNLLINGGKILLFNLNAGLGGSDDSSLF